MAADISVKNQDVAKGWIAEAHELNQLTFDETQGVGGLLQEIKEGAGGELVDTLWNMGKSVLDGAGMIVEGVESIINGIDTIVDVAHEVVGIAKDFINGLKSLFG